MSMEMIKSKLREKVSTYNSLHQFSTALFFADKLVALNVNEQQTNDNNSNYEQNNVEDYYLYSKCLFLNKHYHRAYDLLQKNGYLVRKDNHVNIEKFILLGAQCKFECGEWEKCLDVLGDIEQKDINSNNAQIISSQFLLKGRACENLSNPAKARFWYTQTLQLDPSNYDALQRLTTNHLLNESETHELLATLKFPQEDDWIKDIYYATQRGDSFNQTSATLEFRSILSSSCDVLAMEAENHFYSNRFNKAYEISKKLIDNDVYYYGPALSVYLSCLVELKLKNELFLVCHRLSDANPNMPVSLYAIACYYFLLGKYEESRRYFSKATVIDPQYGPAWLGFGHAFATQGEHDQAMAAYRSANRTLTGSHLPALCIGMELIRVNNLNLSTQYLAQSQSLCSTDPIVYNELGVINLKNRDYSAAIHNFSKALDLGLSNGTNFSTTHDIPEMWEATLFNIGHAYRKLKDYTNAVKYYQMAITTLSNNPGAYCALAFTYHLMGNIPLAIEYYHQSLALRDDSFATVMLSKALEESMDSLNSFLNIGKISPNNNNNNNNNIETSTDNNSPLATPLKRIFNSIVVKPFGLLGTAQRVPVDSPSTPY
eukprot:TRINITY_DN5421_c0_g2_i1.p1 TRINITY_DN5421_c0_g2~~TRINITY_DN5421_c0_g2_i1.p1  ORF type:complete len:600 (+),score=102.05 TRINITY_DN5421_c0_g2_i1:113-1912(+)